MNKYSRKKFSVYIRLRRRKNRNVKIKDNLNRGLRYLLKGQRKSPSVARLLGCSIEEFRQYIESKFKLGMTWDNYGIKWELDHIKSCSKYLLTCKFHQKACYHYSNLQPLFKDENRKKSFVEKKEEQLTFA